MNKEELEKDYYADRPIEPYCDDDSPNDWANIAHYAEENLGKAFKRITELEAQIEKMKWHYLVKDSKDLPKKEGSYWVCTRDGRYKEDGSWEWTSKPHCQTAVWLDGVFGYAGGSPVIGWCELPKWGIKEND